MTETSEQPTAPPLADGIPAAQFEQLIKAINDRVINPALCRSCNKNQVSIAPHAVAPPIFHNGGTMLGGTNYPQIMLVCGYCGATHYHNILILDAQLGDGDGA